MKFWLQSYHCGTRIPYHIGRKNLGQAFGDARKIIMEGTRDIFEVCDSEMRIIGIVVAVRSNREITECILVRGQWKMRVYGI